MDEEQVIRLASEERMVIAAALGVYLRWFDEHRREDHGNSHPEKEWQEFQQQVRALVSRIVPSGRMRT